jgi:DNA-binding response OmpR family regulator
VTGSASNFPPIEIDFSGVAVLVQFARPAVAAMKKPKILVVDDNPDIVSTIVPVLNNNGYEAVGAAGGAEGLHLALTSEFDLVISDIQMSDVNGVELLTQLKNAKVKTRFICITGAAVQLRDTVKFVRLGACDVLHKPVEMADFLSSVKRALALESPLSLSNDMPRIMEETITAAEAVERDRERLRKEKAELTQQMGKEKAEFASQLREAQSELDNKRSEVSKQQSELDALKTKSRLQATIIPLIFLAVSTAATAFFYEIKMIPSGWPLFVLPIVLFVLLSLPFDRIKSLVAKTKQGEGKAVFK